MPLNQQTILLNSAPCGIFSFTEQGIITFINPLLLQQLQYTNEELNGRYIEKIFTLSTRIFYQTHLAPLLKLQGEVNEVFVTLLDKNNGPVPVLMNASQVKNESGCDNICACITVQQRKKYEDEILNAKKAAEEALHKNELLQKAQHQLEISKQELDKQMTQLKHTNNELLQLNDIVAHDLQEPVRKISLYVDKLQSEWQNANYKNVSASFEIITRSANRIRKVLQSLQEYMNILTRKIEKKPVNLHALIEEQIKIISRENTEVQVVVSIEKLPEIEADPEQMKILFFEIFKNCVSFRSVERSLLIQITGSIIEENFYNFTEGKYKYIEFAKITIEDNGIGFNPRFNEMIFKLLKRLDSKKSGLGFGLAICKRIAENHRGYLTAEGEENKGAKFTVSLPAL